MKIAIVTGSILLALAGSAAAQPGLTPPTPEPLPQEAPRPAGEPMSERFALTLSLGGTIGSWALLFGSGMVEDRSESAGILVGTVGAFGIVLAPSFGHWYAGKILTRGLGLRVAGAVGGTVGFILALGAALSEGGDSSDGALGAGLLIGGAVTFVVGTIDDIVTAPRRVRRLNQERGFAIAPMPMVTAGGAGLALGGRF